MAEVVKEETVEEEEAGTTLASGTVVPRPMAVVMQTPGTDANHLEVLLKVAEILESHSSCATLQPCSFGRQNLSHISVVEKASRDTTDKKHLTVVYLESSLDGFVFSPRHLGHVCVEGTFSRREGFLPRNGFP